MAACQRVLDKLFSDEESPECRCCCWEHARNASSFREDWMTRRIIKGQSLLLRKAEMVYLTSRHDDEGQAIDEKYRTN